MASLSDDGLPWSLPVRRVVLDLQWSGRAKQLLTFVLFFAVLVTLGSLRTNTPKGHETLSWLREAHERAELKELSDLNTVDEVSEFYSHGLPQVADALVDICSNCLLAMTPHEQELAFLGLESFICSGFDSTQGSSHYPERDCAAADASWAAHPTSDSAPCCLNATLVTASIAMMTEMTDYGVTSLPLHTLLNGGSTNSI